MNIRREKFFPFLEQFVKLVKYDPHGFTLEGDIIWPTQVKLLSAKFEIKSIFLGFESITLSDIIDNIGSNDWVLDLSKKEREEMPKWLSELSREYKVESEKYGYRYIDMSGDFEGKLKEAENYLLK
jgi:hypothetical protein